MPIRLPDPRSFDAGKKSRLGEAVDEIVAAPPAVKTSLLRQLSERISVMLVNGDEPRVREALASPSSTPACRALLRALELALSPKGDEGGVNVRVFAIPVLFVVGGAPAARVSGVVPDVDEIRSLFETAGTLGHCRNFGLSNALTHLGSLESIPWSTLHAIAHRKQWNGLAGLDLPPVDIPVTANRETVHLRFLVGAALTPGDVPGFIEAAGDIGRWGMQFTQLIGRQLATQEVSLLAIPRSPVGTVSAAQQGWYVAREMGFQLFLSDALRKARLGVGEPEVAITACTDQIIRVRLTSPFDDLFDHTYGWPLMLSDEFDEIESSIFGMLKEARVERIQVAPTIEDFGDAKRASH